MNILTIIIVAWSLSFTTSYIQPAVIVGYANMNIEAILQENTVIVLSPEEDIKMFVKQKSDTYKSSNEWYRDKEMPAT
jgi:hypothetical protein